jgi:hypothetical protein
MTRCGFYPDERHFLNQRRNPLLEVTKGGGLRPWPASSGVMWVAWGGSLALLAARESQ